MVSKPRVRCSKQSTIQAVNIDCKTTTRNRTTWTMPLKRTLGSWDIQRHLTSSRHNLNQTFHTRERVTSESGRTKTVEQSCRTNRSNSSQLLVLTMLHLLKCEVASAAEQGDCLNCTMCVKTRVGRMQEWLLHMIE